VKEREEKAQSPKRYFENSFIGKREESLEREHGKEPITKPSSKKKKKNYLW